MRSSIKGVRDEGVSVVLLSKTLHSTRLPFSTMSEPIPDGICRLRSATSTNPDPVEGEYATSEGPDRPIRAEPARPPYVERQQVWVYHYVPTPRNRSIEIFGGLLRARGATHTR